MRQLRKWPAAMREQLAAAMSYGEGCHFIEQAEPVYKALLRAGWSFKNGRWHRPPKIDGEHRNAGAGLLLGRAGLSAGADGLGCYCN